jgi:hypothetical protein
MWRRLRWVLLAVIVALVAAVVTAVIVEKPTLDDDEQAVDTRWAELRDALEPRYAALEPALATLDAIGEADRAVTQDLSTALSEWTDSLDGGSAEQQAEVANRVEAQANRLRANVFGSPRLAQSTELADAIGAFDAASPPDPLVETYNRAVRTYEDSRNDTFRRPVALVFGYGARPLFFVAN